MGSEYGSVKNEACVAIFLEFCASDANRWLQSCHHSHWLGPVQLAVLSNVFSPSALLSHSSKVSIRPFATFIGNDQKTPLLRFSMKQLWREGQTEMEYWLYQTRPDFGVLPSLEQNTRDTTCHTMLNQPHWQPWF